MMTIVTAQCPSCGKMIQLDAANDFGFCSYCGNKIFTNKIEGSDFSILISDYFTKAYSAYEAKNYQQAEEFCSEINKISFTNYEAWFLKAKCILWQSTKPFYNNRSSEWVDCMVKALNNAPEEEIKKLECGIKETLIDFLSAVSIQRAQDFVENPDIDQTRALQQTYYPGYGALFRLEPELGKKRNLDIDWFKENVENKINRIRSKILGGAVVDALVKIEADYQGKMSHNEKPIESDFFNYAGRLENCSDVLKYSLSLNKDNGENDISRYENLILINKRLAQARYWDYEFVTYDGGKRLYGRSSSYKDEHKRFLNNQTEEWYKAIKEIDPGHVISATYPADEEYAFARNFTIIICICVVIASIICMLSSI